MEITAMRIDVKKMESWRPWFALLPKRLNDGRLVWLEWAERRLEGGRARFDYDGLIAVWEYRAAAR